MAMTELKVKIKNPQLIPKVKGKDGAYLAKFFIENDRILIYRAGRLTGVIECKSFRNIFALQLDQNSENYSNLKKIKNMTIEVELE